MTKTTTDQTQARGTLIMVAVVLIWGGFLPVSKAALLAIDPYWLPSAGELAASCWCCWH